MSVMLITYQIFLCRGWRSCLIRWTSSAEIIVSYPVNSKLAVIDNIRAPCKNLEVLVSNKVTRSNNKQHCQHHHCMVDCYGVPKRCFQKNAVNVSVKL